MCGKPLRHNKLEKLSYTHVAAQNRTVLQHTTKRKIYI